MTLDDVDHKFIGYYIPNMKIVSHIIPMAYLGIREDTKRYFFMKPL